MHSGRRTGTLQALWQDEHGALAGADYVLVMTIFVIGSLVGLVTVRDSVVQQLGDVGLGLEHLDQSYTVSITLADASGGPPTIVEYGFVDTQPDPDVEGAPPGDITICLDLASGEN